MSASKSKELAKKIAVVCAEYQKSEVMTAFGVVFASTVVGITKDVAAQDEAIELFSTQARALMDLFNAMEEA